MAHVIVIAGANGAGKSTVAPFLLRDKLGIDEFVNADVLAQGLSAYSPETVAITAGRIMLKRINKLAEAQENFAFETTLSTRTFVPKLKQMRENGYEVSLFFLWLISEELAILRVAERVRQGGHHIPTETIKRRYQKGLSNFLNLYQNLADNWYFYDNLNIADLKLIAKGNFLKMKKTFSEKLWHDIKVKYEK